MIVGFSISICTDQRAAFSAILVVLRHQIAYLFTSDPVVVAGVAQLTIYVALFQVGSSLLQLDTNCSDRPGFLCRLPMVLSVSVVVPCVSSVWSERAPSST